MIKLLIAADDFTGALDSGAQFAKQGIKTLVTTDTDIDFAGVDSGFEVLAVDTQTRHMPAAGAYNVVRGLVKRASENGISHIYKKTDSTLRGNIGAELAGVLDGTGLDRLMFIPAFPDSGRTTKNGIQSVYGVPVSESHFASDPLNPLTTSYIPDIIRQYSNTNTTVISSAHVPLYKDVCGISVFDSETNEDLSAIGRVLSRLGQTKLLAGCAGFAGVLQGILDFSRYRPETAPAGDNILIVSGSINNVSLSQMKYAREHGYMGVSLTPEQKFDIGYPDKPYSINLISGIREALLKTRLAYLEASENIAAVTESTLYAREHNLPEDSLHTIIADRLGTITKQVIKSCKVDNLFVFGGDTALGIMTKLGVKELIPLHELCSGVVISKIRSSQYDLNLITKAGGLGPEDISVIATERLLKS